MKEDINKNCFKQFKLMAQNIETEEDLKMLEKQFRRFSEYFGVFKPTIEAFFVSKYEQFKKERLNDLIKPFQAWEPLQYDLRGEEKVERKIKKIKDPKLKNGFIGLFNLLTDRKNLIYNNLRIRQDILNDLNKFKSLEFFKMSYVSHFDLKKGYGFLAVKRGAQKYHSKLYFIEHGLYILKTVEHDGLTLKAFYINNKIKILLDDSKMNKALPKAKKFNKSSLDAWKTLNKEDNIRFYSYCNSNGLDKKNRQLLKAIHQKQGGVTFDLYLEGLEESIEQLEDALESNPYDIDLNQELDDKKEELTYLTEEHNSDKVLTLLDDYKW